MAVNQGSLEFTENSADSDMNVSLTQESRDYSDHFQTYKFLYSMKISFSNDGDTIIFVGDLLNVHLDALDRVFETVFMTCMANVNLQHFNRESIMDTDYVQFTVDHANFIDFVFSSRNVKYSDLNVNTLVGGVMNWLSNLAQSNSQININNDWGISLQVSRTTEVPRGFGRKKDFGLQSKVNVNVQDVEGEQFGSYPPDENSPEFNPDTIVNVQVQ